MGKLGKIVFGIGVFLAIIMGVIVSYDPGYVCQLDVENLPTNIWSYPALCFVFWAFSVPLGFMIAATGILIHANANRSTILKFGLGIIGTYLFASYIKHFCFHKLCQWTNASRPHPVRDWRHADIDILSADTMAKCCKI